MKITLRDVWVLGQAAETAALNKTAPPMAKLASINLPVKTAYWFSKKAAAIDKEYALVREQWIKLIRQFGREVGKDNLQVWPKKEPEFRKAFELLLSEEIEIPGPAIGIDELPDGAQLSGADMTALEFLFDMGIEQDSIAVEEPVPVEMPCVIAPSEKRRLKR